MVQVTISPAALLDQGIYVENIDGLRLFRLSESFQDRIEKLLEINETADLSAEEQTELNNLTELERFFTYLNARLMAEV